MSFFKTAKTTILAFKDYNQSSSFTRTAATKKVASFYGEEGPNIFSAEDVSKKLEIVADEYKISKNPEDYIYVAVRALTADVPNENHDAFSEKELLRFEQKHGCKIYQTFNLKPHHVNHRSADITQARGVILDSHYNTKNEGHFPEILIAVDKTKDKRLAEGIATGELTGFSMGCSADFTICSICNHKASSPADFCKHIRFNKGKDIEGKVAFEWCEGVTFEEESSVDDPADKTALTQEVILANKKEFEKESELLAMSAKINTLNANVSKLLETVNDKTVASENIENKATIEKNDSPQKDLEDKNQKDLEDKNQKDLEEFKENKKVEENKKKTKEEYGVNMNPTAGVENNPYISLIAKRKVALDKGGTDYWLKYQGDYGTERTKDIKKKKVRSERKADKGQLFTKLDNVSGNPPKEFNVDKKSGNPPKEWKFAKLHSDVEVFAVSRVSNKNTNKSKYYLVAKANSPMYFVANPEIIQELPENGDEIATVAYEMLSGIAQNGLTIAMSRYNAKKLKALYDVSPKGPSIVDNPYNDLRLKKTKPTQGTEEGGTDDLDNSDRGSVREKAINDDGVRDLKASREKRANLEQLLTMVDEAEQKGQSDEEILKMVDTYIKSENPSGVTTGSKNASASEGGLSDLATGKKPEPTKGVTANGDDDLGGVNRDSTKADQVYSGGKDDLDIARNNAVDLKANRRKISKNDSLHSLDKKEYGEQVNKNNWADASNEKWKSIQKASITAEVKREFAKESAEYRKAFRERFARAIKLAATRTKLNLIDNELKIAMADVLITPTEEYIGMEEELAKNIIESSFAKGGDRYIVSLLKEAEQFIEMPQDSFLKIEEDTNKLNLVLPVADVKEHGIADLPGEEEFTEPISEEDFLIEKASKNNPIFSPKGGSLGKFDNLRGIFSKSR